MRRKVKPAPLECLPALTQVGNSPEKIDSLSLNFRQVGFDHLLEAVTALRETLLKEGQSEEQIEETIENWIKARVENG